MKNRILIFLILISFFIFSPITYANIFSSYDENQVISVYDQNDNYIFSIAMGVVSGDKYLSTDNIEYEIVKVEGNKAYAKKKGKVNLTESVFNNNENDELNFEKVTAAEKRLIAIYHTHNGESYLPGEENKRGRGDIHDIGQKLANSLKKEGVDVLHSDNMHLPHDGAAYERSRATALELARKRPDAIFDIHRDAIPDKNEYLEKVNGRLISQVRIVVGRQNPNRSANDKFAKSLKAVSDEYYPGLIRDIFYGGGAYNQQLASRALLLEFGSHVTGKDNAIASAQLFSGIVNQLLYGKESKLSDKSKAVEGRSTLRTILIFISVFIFGLFAYLYISEGSVENVKVRIKKYFAKEIIDKNNGDK